MYRCDVTAVVVRLVSWDVTWLFDDPRPRTYLRPFRSFVRSFVHSFDSNEIGTRWEELTARYCRAMAELADAKRGNSVLFLKASRETSVWLQPQVQLSPVDQVQRECSCVASCSKLSTVPRRWKRGGDKGWPVP